MRWTHGRHVCPHLMGARGRWLRLVHESDSAQRRVRGEAHGEAASPGAIQGGSISATYGPTERARQQVQETLREEIKDLHGLNVITKAVVDIDRR